MPYWIIFIGILLITGCTAPPPSITARLDAVEAINRGSDSGFARVLEPRPFVFPQDHGPHPEYAIEWWYYTGNLDSGERRFGYQLTFFRSALTPEPPERSSPWGTSTIYMAHLALSDVANDRFYAFERFSRDAVGLAGASGEPFRVFLEDWSAEGSGPEGMTMHLRAAEEDVALDLTIVSRKAPALQGDQGLSQKGSTLGNASFYYSLTQMETNGTVRIGDAQYAVTGFSWMDHEWGTSALEDGAVGWDWFSIQLDDGREIMYAQVRTADAISYRLGSLVEADGTIRILDQAPVILDVLDTWRSPRSGAVYPSGWQLTIPELALELTIQPVLRDQELPVTIIYWEGAVDVRGSQGGQPLSGRGYVELTGYAGDDCRSVDCRW